MNERVLWVIGLMVNLLLEQSEARKGLWVCAGLDGHDKPNRPLF